MIHSPPSYPAILERPAYPHLFKIPTTHADRVLYDTQFLLNNITLWLWDLVNSTGTDALAFAAGHDAGLDLARNAFGAINVQTRAELEDIMALIFGAVLDHHHRDHARTGSKMAARCADIIRDLEERYPEFRERVAETGTEVGKMRFFNGISKYGN